MKKTFLSLLVLCVISACGGSDDGDTRDLEYPVISDAGIVANPIDCQVYQRGQAIAFNYIFTDNVELGKFTINVHDNFDHHTHGGSAGDCVFEADKTPVNPWIFEQPYTIPAGSKSYHAQFEIQIPASIDPGDYHFMISLTDKSGWQTIKPISIKIE